MPPRFDPAASLRIWAIEATLGGRLLRIPPLPAADWLPVVITVDAFAVRELVEDFDLAEALVEDGITAGELRDVFVEMLEAATGRSSIAAWSIAASAGERWDVIGADLARAGVDFERISIGAALDAIYGTLCRNMDEKSLADFVSVLERGQAAQVQERRPPRGAKPLPASAEQYVRERPKTVLLPRPDRPDERPVSPTARPLTPSGNARRARSGATSPASGVASPQVV